MNFFSALDRAFHTFGPRRQNELCTVSTKQVAALDGHRFRHNQNRFITFRCSYQSKPDTRVTAGRLDDRVARLDAAFLLSHLDHADRNTVFHASTRVLVLQLNINFRTALRHDTVQFDKRRIPNQIRNALN